MDALHPRDLSAMIKRALEGVLDMSDIEVQKHIESGNLRPGADIQNLFLSFCFRHTADNMAEKELACLVAGIRLDWPAGRSNIGCVGGHQSDFECSRAGRSRESLLLLAGILKIGC